MSVANIRAYIRQNPGSYADFFSDLIESFFFMSNLRFTVIACLFLSNVSNFLRTDDALSLIVNLPSELLLLLYPTLRRKQIIPQGQGSLFCFVFILMLSLQWSFSFWVFVRNNVQLQGPAVLTIVLSVLWVFSLGPSVLKNMIKASVCSLLFLGILYAADPDYIQGIKGSLVLGFLLGIGLNQSMDQMLRFRFYIEHQQKTLLEKNAKIELIMRTSRVMMFSIDRRLQIHSEYTADRVRLFGQTSNPGTLDSFLGLAELSAADKTAMKSALEAMLDDNEISFTINEHALMKKFRLQTAGDGCRSVMASYAPLLNQDGQIMEILLAITDVTALEDQESRQKLASLETECLLVLLRAPREQLELFMSESLHILQILGGRTSPDTLLRSLHTFKGNCRTLGFKSLSQLLHETEAALQSGIGFDECVQTVSTVLDLLLSVYHERFQGHLELTDFKEFFEHLAHRAAAQISQSLDKPVPQIHLTTTPGLDSPELRKLMFQILPHLLANALDHGIESADKRAACGKSVHGNIYVDITQDTLIHLSFRDDGRGLALHKLRERLGQAESSDQDIAHTLFSFRTTTKSSVSEISGRGVGLNAVADAVRGIGGDCRIILGDQTEAGFRSFTIVLKIPHPALQTAV